MRLLFTKHRSVKATAIKCLPPLHIIIDYKSGAESIKARKRMVSALTCPDRVCGIAFKVPTSLTATPELLTAINQPFPSLDSLELDCATTLEQNYLPPFLTVQPPHLRRLKLTNNDLRAAVSCHILSCTKSLVDLTLNLSRIFFSPFETQLLSHLQDMPFLRRLKLELCEWYLPSDIRSNDPSRTKGVLLPELNFLRFTGHITQLEALMACLAAPSLQELRVALQDSYSSIFYAPHLSKFVSNIGNSFSCAQLHASRGGINLFMLTHTQPPFKVIVNPKTLIEEMGVSLSATLATVEDVFLTSSFLPMAMPHGLSWCKVFVNFLSAKTLRISPGVEREVLDIFQLGDRQCYFPIFPALEEVELNATMYPDAPTQIDEGRQAAILGLFNPLVDARQEKGHTVNIHWNTDRVLPKYFYDSDTDM